MQGILRANPSAEIYLELWPAGLRRAGCSVEMLAHWLRGLGYHIYRTDGSQPLDDATLAAVARKLTGVKHTDLIARHNTCAP
jgi:hypothetical protein